jgi:hypothetical protein
MRTPFQALGYQLEYVDVSASLPSYPLVGRYAGIVTWFSDDQAVRTPGVREWLARQRESGMRMAMLGHLPFPLSDSLAVTFGLSAGAQRVAQGVTVELRDPVMGQDTRAPSPALFTPLRANDASVTLLRVRAETGETMDAAALMPWGGYVLAPYEAETVPETGAERWLIEPVEFMRRALGLAPVPRHGGAILVRQNGVS